MCEDKLSCPLDFKRNKKKRKKTNKGKNNHRYRAAITSHMTRILIQRKQVLTSGNMTLSPKALKAGKYCCQKDKCIWKQISKLIETAAVWQELQKRANTSWQSNHYSWCTWSWSENRSSTNTLTYQNSFKYRNERIQHISMNQGKASKNWYF